MKSNNLRYTKIGYDSLSTPINIAKLVTNRQSLASSLGGYIIKMNQTTKKRETPSCMNGIRQLQKRSRIS
jgi:hypothetical protein